jgi:hypothetical protein
MANNVLYKHTARLPQAGPEAAAFHEGENSVSETKEIHEVGYGKPPPGRRFQTELVRQPARPGGIRVDGCLKVAPGPLHNGALVWYRVILSLDTLRFRRSCLADGGSSNGRTADSDSASLGSNPSPPANRERP